MKETRDLMGMPVTVEIRDEQAIQSDINKVFEYLEYVDATFSTYKEDSEISRINRGELEIENASADMHEIFRLGEDTKRHSGGFFDIKNPKGQYDPSGIVKGWAILNASNLLKADGFKYFYVDVGGDIQTSVPDSVKKWTIGIRNPFKLGEIVKVLTIANEGVATSGTYIRGQHVYDPFNPKKELQEIVSLTVVGPNIYEADRFATAAFAMGERGMDFIMGLKGFECYAIDKSGRAAMTPGFTKYVNI